MIEDLFNPYDQRMGISVSNLERRERFLPGTFIVDTLPSPADYPFMYAAVTDLGTGPDMVVSDGKYWKLIRRGIVQTVPANTNIVIDPLKSPTMFSINGSITTAMNFGISDTSRLYPGYALTIKRQSALSTVLGLVGSLGIKVGQGANLALTETTSNLVWTGTEFIQI